MSSLLLLALAALGPRVVANDERLEKRVVPDSAAFGRGLLAADEAGRRRLCVMVDDVLRHPVGANELLTAVGASSLLTSFDVMQGYCNNGAVPTRRRLNGAVGAKCDPTTAEKCSTKGFNLIELRPKSDPREHEKVLQDKILYCDDGECCQEPEPDCEDLRAECGECYASQARLEMSRCSCFNQDDLKICAAWSLDIAEKTCIRKNSACNSCLNVCGGNGASCIDSDVGGSTLINEGVDCSETGGEAIEVRVVGVEKLAYGNLCFINYPEEFQARFTCKEIERRTEKRRLLRGDVSTDAAAENRRNLLFGSQSVTADQCARPLEPVPEGDECDNAQESMLEDPKDCAPDPGLEPGGYCIDVDGLCNGGPKGSCLVKAAGGRRLLAEGDEILRSPPELTGTCVKIADYVDGQCGVPRRCIGDLFDIKDKPRKLQEADLAAFLAAVESVAGKIKTDAV